MLEKANLKVRVRASVRARARVRARVRVQVISVRVRVSEHRDAEDEPEEDEVGQALGEHRGGEAHLGDEGVGELDDLEQLDAHAEREVDLGRAQRGEHLPVVLEAHRLAEQRTGPVVLLLEHGA